MAKVEDNIRRHIDAFNAHDSKAWASHYKTDALVEDPYYAEPLRGRAAVEKDIADFFRAFPDVRLEVNNVIAKDGTFALECTVRGTHQGTIELPAGKFEATNRRVEFKIGIIGGVDEAGDIVEEHRYFDVAKQMGQLGLTH
jgi:steroid delta-isomerase-like uncharacterized protein